MKEADRIKLLVELDKILLYYAETDTNELFTTTVRNSLLESYPELKDSLIYFFNHIDERSYLYRYTYSNEVMKWKERLRSFIKRHDKK